MGQKEKRIGVVDSGLGGLTLVKELELQLPGEDIVYFGDNVNCPFGNRPREEILKLALVMLGFMQAKGVKAVAVACNTISTLVDELRKRFEFPIVSVIEEACKNIAAMKLAQTGLFATEFTIKEGLYDKELHRLSPQTKVFGLASRSLATLVDEGRFNEGPTTEEVHSLLNTLLKAHPGLKHIVLGCTHYPVVQDLFEKEAPGISFINPAAAQAGAVKALLLENGLANNSLKPALDIYTSGQELPYKAAIKKLVIGRPYALSAIK